MKKNHNRSRPVMYEVTKKEFSIKNNNEQQVKPIPLELAPVIETILAYGKKTNSLGAYEVIDVLTKIVNKVKQLKIDETDIELKNLISSADKTINNVKNKFARSYEQ